ncbi:RagB/SusD family nutrient uptake outer membrane protein [Fulvivirga sp. M361]|uniref:RagB/SusD family nutrient uptake outer membrane protein n=1 Tax=Fulvivirga sp. M361 TaxID=2594266 RepID=UPI001179EF57|nr:RagB/SusD family nutrient uptake outer membrane protein [Fulvivirga sp. M361]TRX61690.1 RagB/SusD family nutrient uptake outer membrane protein [Fulvivirga sp. M361]
MKVYRYIIMVGILFLAGACDEDILDETPLDFLSPENSFTTPEDIEAALFLNYDNIRNFYDGKYFTTGHLHSATDLAMSSRGTAIPLLEDYTIDLNPTSFFVANYWNAMYSIIFNTNVILGRLDGIDYDSEDERTRHKAEASFFRGYAYRCLVNLYGGVPIVLDEISSPKRDFVRDTKEATVAQAISDLEFAAENLPNVSEIPSQDEGRLVNAAALHTLAELYITSGDLDKSIAAASAVIDDPNISLMTTRFGNRATDDGDPYWDLFQRNNQNRASGNTEGIYVIQTETNVPGGSTVENFTAGLSYERNYGPLYFVLKDPDGEDIFLGPTTQAGGRPVGFIRPTPYFTHTIWGNGNFDVDVRNHERNIQRDWMVDNPGSAYFGQNISDLPQSWFDGLSAQDTLRDFFPNVTKITTKNDHPADAILDATTGELSPLAGKTHTDWYLMRVAETYLLRAEAYLAQGNTGLAAADINMLRNRAGAIPVAEGDVDIDYILDERLRELNWEEQRRMTLSRLNLLFERTVMANPTAGPTIQPFNNLFPIPFREIETNTETVLEQNPGYN